MEAQPALGGLVWKVVETLHRRANIRDASASENHGTQSRVALYGKHRNIPLSRLLVNDLWKMLFISPQICVTLELVSDQC